MNERLIFVTFATILMTVLHLQKSNTNIHASVQKPTIIETVRLNRLRWFGHVQRMEGNGIPKRVIYI